MWLYVLIGYFVIGIIVGINHLSGGKVGARGPIATIVAAILLWPIFLAVK